MADEINPIEHAGRAVSADQFERFASKIDTRLADLTTQVTQYVTVTRRSLVEQAAINERHRREHDDYEKRLRQLERWSAQTSAKLPPKWLDHDDVVEQLEDHETRISAQQQLLARWGGIAAVIFTVLQVVVSLATKWLIG